MPDLTVTLEELLGPNPESFNALQEDALLILALKLFRLTNLIDDPSLPVNKPICVALAKGIGKLITALKESRAREEDLSNALEQAQDVIELMTETWGTPVPVQDGTEDMTAEEWREEIEEDFDNRKMVRDPDGQVSLSSFVFVPDDPESHLLFKPQYAEFLRSRDHKGETGG